YAAESVPPSRGRHSQERSMNSPDSPRSFSRCNEVSARDEYLGSPMRRSLLRAAPGSLAWTLLGGLAGAGRVASAQALDPNAVPVVDRLSVRIVTDSYHHAFEPSRTVGDVQIQRVGTSLSKDGPPRTLQ